MTAETIALTAGLIFVFVAIVGGGITGDKFHVPELPSAARLALGVIGFALCLPFIIDKIGGVPRGTIVAWTKESGDIPKGWAICDGTKGTPKLDNVFLKGVTTLTRVGDTGGVEIHRHSFFGVSTNAEQADRTMAAIAHPPPNFQNPETLPTRAHTHAYSGTTESASNLPPFVTVIYIMKL